MKTEIKDRETQSEVVRLLLTLLPPANRDTLWALLRFLATVHRHSGDSSLQDGTEVRDHPPYRPLALLASARPAACTH